MTRRRSRIAGRARRTARGARGAAVILLASALIGCSSAPAVPDQLFTIAGGGTAGVYYAYGEQLAEALHEEVGIDVMVAETQGSVENLRLVAEEAALVGFAQGDTAADAVAGSGAFEDPLPVTAVARVYDEYVHLVVPADSDVQDVTGLAGSRVSLGAENSGVQVIATRVLAAAQVDIADVDDPQLGLNASISALRDGEIDAFFWVGGIPTPSIESLAEEMPLRLLPIKPETVDRVNAGHAGVYRSGEFPSGTYGAPNQVTTMTVPNYLVASSEAPPELIRKVVQVLFAARPQIAREVRAAEFLDIRQAIFTGPVELHPGAAEFYVESRH
ncbi:TAXI family TRAP transporter solute-binding subunit [Leucobacter sp. GX24907]